MSVGLEASPLRRQRILALDALRGLSILLMLFASEIPFGVLPSWMYHAQEPPPTHVFNPGLPGITWVDLVFPFFLFTMGAAIPLALSRRVKSGVFEWRVVSYLFGRGILLGGFAIYVMQIRPNVISSSPDWRIWLVALLGFAILFPALAKLPDGWSKGARYLVRFSGWIAAILLMAFIRFPDGSGFTLYRSDIIILVLANVAFFGGIIWILTREKILIRLGVMGLLIAFRLSANLPGWTQAFWNWSPLPWLYEFRFLQYLLIVIPGTIVGDIIIRWMNRPADEQLNVKTWSASRLVTISVLMLVINATVVAGMKAQWVLGTSIIAIVLSLLGLPLMKSSSSQTENLIHTIYRWGVYWVLLGLAFEPYEGGIKKDPATLSYYFVTAGLAIFVLILLMILIDIFKGGKALKLLVDSGQNPLVAYAGINNLIAPILALTGIDGVLQALTPTPWLGVLRGAFITYLIALATAIFTRNRIYLKT